MIRVKPKAETSQAWRYEEQPQSEWPAWVRSCVSPTGDGSALCLSRKSGKQWLYPGEWLVRDLDGAPEWLPHDQMCREFDEVLA